MAASNLTLVLPPQLFSNIEQTQFLSLLNKNIKSLVNLRRVLSRGEHQAFATQEIILSELFGLPYTNMAELPLAAIKALGSGFDAATGYWMHAEPVHLHPDLDHVLLFDSSTLALAKNELGQLVEELQELLEESGLQVRFGKQNNLFLRIDNKPDVSFTSLEEVTGKNILQHLPEGKDSAQWRLLQNEIQMQMTQSSVNQRREERGGMTANGLWFWGEGYLLRAKYKRCYDIVFTDQLLTMGLAIMVDAVIEKDSSDFDSINMNQKTLVAIASPESTLEASLNILLDFDRHWLQPALAAVKKGELESLTLVTGKTRTTYTKNQQKRFWKRAISAEAMLGLLS